MNAVVDLATIASVVEARERLVGCRPQPVRPPARGTERAAGPLRPGPLPDGVVTFVCAKTVDSLRQTQRFGQRALDVLDGYRSVVRDAVSAGGGVVVDGEERRDDDELVAAFSDPAAAVRFSVELQAATMPQRWPDDAELQVGVGVHTGIASPRGGRYVALALYQTRRLAGAANGTQIVVSPEVAAFAAGCADIELQRVGRYRVQDFNDTIELYLATHPTIVSSDLPLQAEPAERHNIATPRTSFVGRNDEINDLAARVAAGRLVTVVGAGGMGKTRLVAEYGLRHADRWFDGIWWVALSGVADGNLVVQAVTESLGVPTVDAAAPLDAVIGRVARAEAVLVLDNCEHVRGAVAPLADRLLRSCPSLRIIATSREPLGLLDEQILRLAPLDDHDAAELFLARSAGLREGVDGDPNVGPVCRHLDGLPLAVELVAAHAEMLRPAEMLALLQGSWSPRSNDPTLEPRQQDLARLVEWSYAQLPPAERAGFRQLSVFGGDFSLDAACVALGPDAGEGPGGARGQAAEIVWSLARKSLLELSPVGGTTRYRMLSSVRAVARSSAPRAELLSAATRVADHFVAALGPAVRTVDHTVTGRRAQELPNLRHLVTVLADHVPELADDLAWTVSTQQRLTSKATAAVELRDYLTRHPHGGAHRVGLLVEAGRSATERGALEVAERYLDDARRLAAARGVPPCFDMQIEMLTAVLYLIRGAPNLARLTAQAALPSARTAAGRALMLQLAGTAACEVGEHRQARNCIAEALALQLQMGDLLAAATQLGNLAEVALRDGELAEAARHQRQALTLALQAGDTVHVAFAALVAAQLAAAAGRWATVAACLGGADRLLDELDERLLPSDAHRRSELVALVEAELGVVAGAAAVRAGRMLDVQDLVVMARGVFITSSGHRTPLSPSAVSPER